MHIFMTLYWFILIVFPLCCRGEKEDEDEGDAEKNKLRGALACTILKYSLMHIFTNFLYI